VRRRQKEIGMQPAKLFGSTLSVVLVAHLPAQTVHHVGVLGFATIQAAIQAASPGDIVRVDPGVHAAFTLDKGLTIVGSAAGGTSILSFGNTAVPIVDVPAGQTAHLVQLQFTTMRIVGGQVTVDRCAFTGSRPRLNITNAVAHLQHCSVIPTGNSVGAPEPTVFVHAAAVFASDCTIHGLPGSPFGAPGTAIAVNLSTFHGSHLTVAAGTSPSTAAVPAVAADAASTLQLSDSVLSTTSGPCPVVATNGRIARCTLTPSCSPLPALPMLGAARVLANPPQLGLPFSIEFRGDPNALVLPWAALDLVPASVPFLTGALLIDAATAFPAGVLVADPNGVATGTWSIPSAVVLQHRTIWFQGLSGTTLPLASSVACGGVIR
jgi:hypothetical protein